MKSIANFKGSVKEFKNYLENNLLPQALQELEIQSRTDLFVLQQQLS